MRKVILAICITSLLPIAYLAASPYVVVHQMRTAAQQKDAQALSKHIDFPSVRQSLKDQLNTKLAKQLIGKDGKESTNPFAKFGAALAGVLVEKMVDAAVNPTAISGMMAGQKVLLPDTNKPTNPQPDQTSSSNTRPKPFEGAKMGYQGINTFVVTANPSETDGKAGAKFILTRQGINWKLTQIELPLEE